MVARKDWSKIADVVAKSKELGIPYSEGAKRFGVKLSEIYDYNRGYNRRHKKDKIQTGGTERLKLAGDGKAATPKESPSQLPQETPKESPSQLPEEIQKLIRSYRQEHPAYGFKRISDLLKQKYLVVVTRKEIRKILKEAGLLETCDSSFDKASSKKGTRRFEAASPGELWQMDVTYVYISKLPALYLVVIIDDHSRFCVGAELCRDQRADTLISVLHSACTMYGAPRKLLTDQGSGFYSWSRNHTQFQEYLDDQQIEHIVAEPHSPQTQGKIERLMQTIRKELLTRVKFSGFADAKAQIQKFIEGYNFERPHQGIGGKRPSDRFHGVVNELERVESDLADRDLDLSRGYVVYKVQDHRVSIAYSPEGLKVYLNGKLLKVEVAGG